MVQHSQKAKFPWGEMSVGRNVCQANCPEASYIWDKLSMGRVVHGAICSWASCLWGKMFAGRSVHGTKCPCSEMFCWVEFPWSKLFHGAKCLGESCNGANCPDAILLASDTLYACCWGMLCQLLEDTVFPAPPWFLWISIWKPILDTCFPYKSVLCVCWNGSAATRAGYCGSRSNHKMNLNL